MQKEKLIAISEDTVKISEEKSYEYNGKSIILDRFTSFLVTKFTKPNIGNKSGNIQFCNESVIDTIFKNSNKTNMTVLNFASAKNPGGGFLRGRIAQEECLARSSNLYLSLKRFNRDFYKKNKEENNPLYTDNMIFSRNLSFFKDTTYNLVSQPAICNVITSPAVNAGVARDRGVPDSAIDTVMENRIRKIIYLAAQQHTDILVLGAFGCGVFKNDDKKVAKMFYKILEEEQMKYCFDEVIFSIYDNPQKFNNFKQSYS